MAPKTQPPKKALAGPNIPLIVEQEFESVFGRKPTAEESSYWKERYRKNSADRVKLSAWMLIDQERANSAPVVASNPLVVTEQKSLIERGNECMRKVLEEHDKVMARAREKQAACEANYKAGSPGSIACMIARAILLLLLRSRMPLVMQRTYREVLVVNSIASYGNCKHSRMNSIISSSNYKMTLTANNL